MHCQHMKKPLSQKQESLLVRAKNAQAVLTHNVRQIKTECPSTIILTVHIPTKRDRLKATEKPFLVSHPTVVQLTFNHNHPIESGHALSFRPIDQQTREKFYE